MNLLIISLIELIRNKKNILYIVLLVVIITIGISLLTIKNDINKYLNDVMETNIINRTLIINSEDNINDEKIKKMNNVEEVYPLYYPQSANVNNKYNTTIKIASKQEFGNDLIKGDKYDVKSENLKIIIPNTLINGQYNQEVMSLLDSQVNIYINNILYKATIVGIYNDNNNKNYSYIEYTEFNNKNVFKEYSMENTYTVVLNNYRNVDNFIKELQHINIDANIYDESGLHDLKTYYMFSSIIMGLVYFVICIILVILNIIIGNMIIDENKNIALLKSIGYKTEELKFTIYLKLLYIFIISYIIGVLLSFILNYILIIVINEIVKFSVNYDVLVLLKYSCIFLTIPILSIFNVELYSKKIKNVSAIILLKDD